MADTVYTEQIVSDYRNNPHWRISTRGELFHLPLLSVIHGTDRDASDELCDPAQT